MNNFGRQSGDFVLQESVAQQIREDFKYRLIRQVIMSLILIPVIFIVVFSEDRSVMFGILTSVLLPPAFIVILFGLGFSFWNWRCPACNKYLGKAIYPKYCFRCGVQLHD